MDKYDERTIKQITTQYPKDASIKFLVRIISEQKNERIKIEKQLEENKKVLKIATNTTNTKVINELRKENKYIEMLAKNKELRHEISKLRKDISVLATENITLKSDKNNTDLRP